MEHYNSQKWADFLNSSLDELLAMKPIAFQIITPSVLPEKAGVYLITEKIGGIENALYVGRTKNIRQRIYTNHLMGAISNARLKKYIIYDEMHACFGDVQLAKDYIRKHCQVRWIFQDEMRVRGALEGYFTAKLFPKYGIAEEH